MMLKPFRIRHLYGLDHGVVQITAPQYDSTIQSQPDAALAYIDEDDGEVITVGSSFELGQRLDEPVTTIDLPRPDSPLHIFDIRHSAASLATWREYEADTSKVLRSHSDPSVTTQTQTRATSPVDLGLWTTDPEGRPVYERYAERKALDDTPPGRPALHTEPYGGFTTRDDSPRSPVLDFGLQSLLTSRDDGYLPLADLSLESDPGNAPVDQDRNDAVTSTNGDQSQYDPPQGSSGPHGSTATTDKKPLGLEDVITGALQGLDKHLGGLAEFLHTTSNTLHDAAEKTREADTTAVDGLLKGFIGIMGEVGKIGKSMLETLDTEATSLAKDLGPTVDSLDQQANKPGHALPKPAKPSDPSTQAVLVSELQAVINAESKPASVIAIESRPDDGKQHVVAARDRCPKIKSDPPVPPNYSVMSDCPAGLLSIKPAGKSSAPLDPNGQTVSRASSTTQGARMVAEDLNAQNQRPETSPQAFQEPKTDVSGSILDLETSDPDFSARYPPLMSLRRARTVARLNGRSTSPAREQLNTQYALSRYPSIDQLERSGRNQKASTSLRQSKPTWAIREDLIGGKRTEQGYLAKRPENPVMNKKPPSPSVEDFEDEDLPRKSDSSSEILNMKNARGGPVSILDEKPAPPDVPETTSDNFADSNPTLSRPLPGAWPEPLNDAPKARPETSGILFGRMALDQPTTGPNTIRDPPKDVRGQDERHSGGYRYVPSHWPRDAWTDYRPRPNPLSGLHRSQTVTAANPAARLTQPFDPLGPTLTNDGYIFRRNVPSMANPSIPLFPRGPVDSLRRSGSERVPPRRRSGEPHRFNNSNRQPYDPFAPEHPLLDRSTAAPFQPNLPPPVGPRPVRSESRFNLDRPANPPPLARRSWEDSGKTDECVRQLRNMGYGSNEHESSRLNVYAAAAMCDVLEAVEMIEEDRKATGEVWSEGKKERWGPAERGQQRF